MEVMRKYTMALSSLEDLVPGTSFWRKLIGQWTLNDDDGRSVGYIFCSIIIVADLFTGRYLSLRSLVFQSNGAYAREAQYMNVIWTMGLWIVPRVRRAKGTAEPDNYPSKVAEIGLGIHKNQELSRNFPKERAKYEYTSRVVLIFDCHSRPLKHVSLSCLPEILHCIPGGCWQDRAETRCPPTWGQY